jgi:hypothetical protein
MDWVVVTPLFVSPPDLGILCRYWRITVQLVMLWSGHSESSITVVIWANPFRLSNPSLNKVMVREQVLQLLQLLIGLRLNGIEPSFAGVTKNVCCQRLDIYLQVRLSFHHRLFVLHCTCWAIKRIDRIKASCLASRSNGTVIRFASWKLCSGSKCHTERGFRKPQGVARVRSQLKSPLYAPWQSLWTGVEPLCYCYPFRFRLSMKSNLPWISGRYEKTGLEPENS